MNGQNNISVKKHLMQKAALTKTPLSGTFELTPRCNMNCKMCYIRMTPDEMQAFGRERTAEEWIKLGKECVSRGMLFLLLTGGEPFLRGDFWQIYSTLRNLGLCISINTNAVLISDDDIDRLAKEKPQSLNITLYGASNETYERLCRTKNGFDIVSCNIEKLKARDIPVVINVSLTKENISDLENIVKFAKERNIPLKISSYMFNPVRKTDTYQNKSDAVFGEEESAMARFLSTKLTLPEDTFNKLCESFRKDIFSADFYADDCESQGYNMECVAGKSSFWVTWDGRMLACGMMNYPSARLFDIGFENSWKTITQKTDAILLPPECKNCKAKKVCRPCGAIVYTESRDFSKKPPYLCASTKRYIELMKGM